MGESSWLDPRAKTQRPSQDFWLLVFGLRHRLRLALELGFPALSLELLHGCRVFPRAPLQQQGGEEEEEEEEEEAQ